MNKNIEKHIIVDNPEYLKHEYLDRGCSGVCYITKDGHVYKEFNPILVEYYFLCEFTKIKNDSVVFPNELVYLNSRDKENLIGCTLDYIDGTLYKDLDHSNINIMDYIKAADKVEKDLKELSIKNSVQVDDIHPANLIYTPNKEFKIIDTDLYVITFSESPYFIYKSNLREWNNMILTILGRTFPFDSSKLNNLFDLCIFNGKERASILLYELLSHMEVMTSEPIVTVKDFEDNLKLIKKYNI